MVIPALDAAATIGRQVAAVLADRDDRTELVLVDNGSTDDTAAVMRAVTIGHDRVTIVCEPRRGVNLARNAGIAATDAPLIVLCDADDEVEPGWIESLVDALATADLVGGAVRRITPDGEQVGEVGPPDAHDRFGWGLPHAWGCNCGLRREVWERMGGFDPRMTGAGDETDLYLRAQIDGATFAWSERAVVRYSLRADADAHDRHRRDEGWRNLSRSYWYGRLRGWPRDGRVLEDLVKCALLLPLAPFSARWRSSLRWRAMRRRGRLVGAIRFLPGEVRRRPASPAQRSQSEKSRPSRTPRRSFHGR